MSLSIGIDQQSDVAGQGGPATASYFPLFEWLRVSLASVVVLYHEGVTFFPPINGQLAVEVFFALSGWLIGGILIRGDKGDYPLFFFNRFTRIWIPYLFAIAALYSWAAIYEGVNCYWFEYLFYDLTFTHQLFTHFPEAIHQMPLGGSGNQFWSIAVEEQFYLLAPVIMLIPLGRTWPIWLSITAFALWIGSNSAPIALGVTAAIVQYRYGDWHRRGWWRWAVVVITLGSFIMISFVDMQLFRAVFCVGLVLLLAIPGKRTSVSTFVGGISYPVYLNHWMGAFIGHLVTRRILHINDGNLYTIMIFCTVAYSASLIIGSIAYWAVDRPVITHRRRWFTVRCGMACGALAYLVVGIGLVGGTMIDFGYGAKARPAPDHYNSH